MLSTGIGAVDKIMNTKLGKTPALMALMFCWKDNR